MKKNKSILPYLSAMTAAIMDGLTPQERNVLETRFGMNGREKPPGVEEIEQKTAHKLEKVLKKHYPREWADSWIPEEEAPLCKFCDRPWEQDSPTSFFEACYCEEEYIGLKNDWKYETAMRAAATERLPWEYPPER